MNIVIIFILILILFIFFLFRDRGGYTVREIPNFLTAEECDEIINMSLDKLEDSKVYGDTDHIQENHRVSKQCWLGNEMSDVVEKFSKQSERATSSQGKYQEMLQVVRYEQGGFFNSHYDQTPGDEEFCKRMNGPYGPRKYTVLVYLNDDYDGGETFFPNINKEVKPEKGKAVIFENVDSNNVIIKESLHGGRPVTSGTKWICNKWIHSFKG